LLKERPYKMQELILTTTTVNCEAISANTVRPVAVFSTSNSLQA
jgi:hypothetical protein